ncbi:MAG: hypothetical protein IT385_22270 [Deltaproteobacteria bacterium]|nr:hypothetical protein [Deltaproteobacteria bacterium]
MEGYIVLVLIVVLALAGIILYFLSQKGSWSALEKELGLLATFHQKADGVVRGVEGHLEDFDVRAVEESRPEMREDGSVHPVHALDVSVTGDLPDLPEPLARALTLAEDGWRYQLRRWTRTQPKGATPNLGKAWLLQGVALARTLRASKDIPARLFEVLARPDAAAHHATALEHLLADPAQRERAIAVARADASGRLGLVAARHARDLAAAGAVAGGQTAAADEALDWLVTEHPEAPETAAAVAARVERLGAHTPAQIRSVIAGIRRTSQPPRGVDAAPKPTAVAEDALVHLMEHRDEEVGLMAIEALRDVGTTRVRDAIERLAGRGGVRGHVARSALEAIGQRPRA